MARTRRLDAAHLRHQQIHPNQARMPFAEDINTHRPVFRDSHLQTGA